MKALTLLNEKGGVGKTTLAVHIAAALAIRGKQVLLIDADAQANCSGSLDMPVEPMFYNWLVRDFDWSHSLLPVPKDRFSSGQTGCKGALYLLPGSTESGAIPLVIGDPLAIHYRMAEIEDWADVVVFDTWQPTAYCFRLFHPGSLLKAWSNRRNTIQRPARSGDPTGWMI